MVFGKPYKERLEPRRIFAYVPHTLQDGRTVWWQYCWKCVDVIYDTTYVLTWDEAKQYPGCMKRTVCWI